MRRAWDVFLEGADEGSLAAAFDEGLFAPRSTLTPREGYLARRLTLAEKDFPVVLHWTEDFLDWTLADSLRGR